MEEVEEAPHLVGPRLWEIRAVRDIVGLAALGFMVLLAYALRGVLLPVLISLILAYLFDPLLGIAARRWHWPRAVTAAVLVAAFLVLVAAGIYWLWPVVTEQIATLRRQLPAYLEVLAAKSGVDLSLISGELGELIGRADEPRRAVQELLLRLGQALGIMRRVVGMTTYVAVTLILIPIYFYFFVWKFDKATERLGALVPVSKRERVFRVLRKMDRATASFFRGRLFIAVCMGVMFSVGWLLAGVPYWFLLGVLAGFLTIVPYGSVVFWPLAVALKYAESFAAGVEADWISVAVWPSVVYLGVQLLEGWLLTPYVHSEQTEMSVPTVLIVAFAGGALGGFLGLFLAIPVAACAKIFFVEVVLPRMHRWAASS
jgi:predicted PurR-regulated permease PerM